jgi:hypothetical protein
MPNPQTDIRDRIIEWLDEWSHGNAKAAFLSVTDRHQRAHRVDPTFARTWCGEDGQPWPCRTIQGIADALGVAP